MNEGRLPPSIITDLLGVQHEPVICGQAVNLWALVALPDVPELAKLAPFLSKDVDLLGNEESYQRLRSLGIWKNGLRIRPKHDEPTGVVGALVATRPDGSEFTVEVKDSIYGLSPEDLHRFTHITLDGSRFFVMEPHVILKGKLANVLDLDQNGRQDLRHVAILIPCVRHYLDEHHAHCNDNKLHRDHLIALIRESSAVIRSLNAFKVSRLHKLDFAEVFSTSLRQSQDAGIRAAVGQALSHHIAYKMQL